MPVYMPANSIGTCSKKKKSKANSIELIILYKIKLKKQLLITYLVTIRYKFL